MSGSCPTPRPGPSLPTAHCARCRRPSWQCRAAPSSSSGTRRRSSASHAPTGSYLHKISFGLIRVGYGRDGRFVTFGWRRVVLLRFRLPIFDVGPGFGRVTWPIERGVLVAPSGRGRGYLRIDVRRLEPDPARDEERVRIQAIVANFYPFLRGSGWVARLGTFLYAQTQLRVHVFVTRGFLRSLESGDLPPLRPDRARAYEDQAAGSGAASS